MRYQFDDYILDTYRHTLEHQGQPVHVRPRVFQVLAYLLEHHQRVVPRQELFEQVWQGQYVSDAALEGCIKQVRQAIGDSGRTQRLLKTQHGVGYRWVAPVSVQETAKIEPDMADLAPPEHVPASPAVSPPALPERRQLTILSCALADAPYLLSRLDADDLHTVLRAFHTLCADTVAPFGGSLAQRLDDRCLIYFGYPQAHGDDARRAVLSGLHLLGAIRSGLPELRPWMEGTGGVKVGVHTGEVVVDAVDDGASSGALVVGGPAMVASALCELAEPQTVVISTATARLVEGYVTWQALAPVTLPGQRDAMPVYRVTGASGAQMRLDLVPAQRLTPFVGREAELALLAARWGQACDGWGQAVVVNGEAGIGKSRLVRRFAERLVPGGGALLEGRASPYHQQSAFYPLTEVLRHILRLDEYPPAADPVSQCETSLRQYGLAVHRHLPFIVPLLNLPFPPERCPISQLSPPRQRQHTLESLVAIVLALAASRPLLFILEDLHWIDPSSLEWLHLLIDQLPTAAIFLVMTCRPEFQVPWQTRSYFTQVTLNRLEKQQSRHMVESLRRDRALPAPVVQQIVERSDGVPLFIEELSRAVVDTGLERVPRTLQDTLTARLDQMGEAKRTAQLGAVIGRQFGDALLRAVSSLDANALCQDLRRLVDSELLYQRGVGRDAAYRFKHALIQDAAYASLLRRTRQQIHRQIAQALETQFPETKATQPELLAHHYTEAGLRKQAIPYWQQAGQHAYGRSAYAEAIAHLTKGLDVLLTLPDSPERAQQELELQMTLGVPLIASKGWAAPEAQRTYARALALCQRTDSSPYLFAALYGLGIFYFIGAAFQTAYELGEQCLRIARQAHEPEFMLESHVIMGSVLFHQGEFVRARAHLEQGMHLYDPQRHQSHAAQYGQDPGVVCHSVAALTLWLQGYPDQALAHIRSAYTVSQNLTHSMSRMFAMEYAGWLHLFRREGQAARQWAEPLMALASEQDASHILAVATFQRGWALTIQGESAGLPALRQGLAAYRQTGAEAGVTLMLAIVAEMTGQRGCYEEGLALLREALVLVEQYGEHMWEAELYRCQGEILLLQDPQPQTKGSSHTSRDAEACFSQALDIARRQQAKLCELRAATNIAQLWHQQGRRQEARDLLAPVYGWFTEGFDTADLHEAKTLLDELAP